MEQAAPQISQSERSLLQGFLREHIWKDSDTEQQYKYRQIERNELFWNGYHYAFRTTNTQNGAIDWNTNGQITGAADQINRAYDYTLNYYRGDGKKLVGILGRTPNMICSADDESNEAQVARASTANTLLNELRWHWPLENLNAELVRGLWCNGLMFGYTPYYADKRFGETTLPLFGLKQMEIQQGGMLCPQCQAMNPLGSQQCQQCGSPLGPGDQVDPVTENITVQVGEDRFTNGTVGMSIHNESEVIIAPKVKQLSDSPFLVLEKEVYKGEIMRTIPETIPLYSLIDANYGDSGPLGAYGRETRSRTSTQFPTYTPNRKNYWTQSLVWVQPCLYESLSMEPGMKDLGAMLKETYPNGVKIIVVNGVPVKFEDEAMMEVWHECKPEVGNQLSTQSIGSEYIRANRLVDDVLNIMVECAEKGSPITFYDPQRLDPRTIAQHASNPVDFIPVLGGVSDVVKSTNAVEMSPEPMKMLQVFLSGARENAGVTPPLFGGETGSQTLGEAEIKRNMALMPHNVTWNFIRKFWSGCMMNAINQLAKYNYDTVYFGGERNKPAKSRRISDLRELLAGGWHVECEEQIPMTWGQRRAQIFKLIEMPPEISQQLLGLNNPNNVQEINNALGNEDIEVPGVNERQKAYSIIAELAKQEPVQQPGPDGQMTMLPSIPADAFEDDHDFMVKVVREWASTPTALNLKKQNPGGYANVIAWGKEHQQLGQPPPMMPPGGPGPGGPPPNGGAPEGQDLTAPPPGGISPENQQFDPAAMSGSLMEG